MTGSHRTQRWPPVAALAVGFLMVFVALPNPLRVPNNNPTATAELAPVPGPPEDSDVQGSFSETGLAESAGLGSGGLGGGGAEIPPLPEGQPIPVDKECVGTPPRQTEDPLSPPCVPYWSGKNGGATFRGVTANSIKVMFYNALGVEGDLNKPYDPGTDNQSQADYQTVNLTKTIKYQLRYFQRRFQTYGRRVLLWGQGSSGGTADAQRADAVAAYSEHKPFAAVWLGNDANKYFEKMAQFKVFTFGLNEDVKTEFHERHAPFIWSFFPDQRSQSRWSASFICDKLRPHELPARFAPDPTLRTQKRKIGFIYGKKNTARGDAIEELAYVLMDELKKHCGYEFDAVESFEGVAAAGAKEAPRIMARMKLEGITTLVCYCIPVITESTVRTMQSAASSADYYPEWYWDHQSRMDKPIWQQTYGNPDHFSFGSSYYWRMPAFREQMHYQAYTEETQDGSSPNARFNFNIYYLFLNLFTAIQAAGPTLDPETVERGMFTFRYIKPEDPWMPTGGYGSSGTAPYNFIDTGMGWWWDPKGTPPGGRRSEGCQRVIQDGKRFFWNTWTPGDSDILVGTTKNPCTEDRQRLVDPQPSDF